MNAPGENIDYKSAATALSIWLAEARVKQSINPAELQSNDENNENENESETIENEEMRDRERELYRKLCFMIAQARPELTPIMCDCVLALGGTIENVATLSYVLEKNKFTQETRSVLGIKRQKQNVKSKTTSNIEVEKERKSTAIQVNKLYDPDSALAPQTASELARQKNSAVLPKYLRDGYLGVLNEAVSRKTEKRKFGTLLQKKFDEDGNEIDDASLRQRIDNDAVLNEIYKNDEPNGSHHPGSLAMKPIDITKRSIILTEMLESGNQNNSELYSLRLADLEVEAEAIRTQEKKLIENRNSLLRRVAELQAKLSENRRNIQYCKDVLEY